MNVHLFGAVSSLSCENFCLKKAAEDCINEVGIHTANVLKKNFYMDDCLHSEKKNQKNYKKKTIVLLT